MALYRNIHLSFWQDTKVTDDFTPDDRYFYLYALTNPHTNLCGCYEISAKQISNEMGYDEKRINKLIKRFSSDHNLIRYNSETRELLIFNWHKYNWTRSDKFRKPLLREIQSIKYEPFREFLLNIFDGKPAEYGIDINCMDTYCEDTKEPDKKANSNLNEIKEIVQYLNERCGTKYRYQTEETQKHIRARIAEGYTVNDFKSVIDKKADEWMGTKCEKYLRPQTLFASKFESYLNQKNVKEKYHSKAAHMLDSFYDQTSEWVRKMEEGEQVNHDI